MTRAIVVTLVLSFVTFACSDDDDDKNTYEFEATISEADSTAHFLVGGPETAGSSLLTTAVGWQDMYDGVRTIGSEPGDNIKPESDPNFADVLSEGSDMDVRLSWEQDGAVRTMTLDEFTSVRLAAGATGEGVSMKFTGNNQERAATEPGHRMCLVSCPLGVVTNGALPLKAGADHSFSPSAAMPAAGAKVKVSMGVRGGVRGGIRGSAGR